VTFGSNNPNGVITTPLAQPMQPGQTYTLSFWEATNNPFATLSGRGRVQYSLSPDPIVNPK
jgi:hypothetical protein